MGPSQEEESSSLIPSPPPAYDAVDPAALPIQDSVSITRHTIPSHTRSDPSSEVPPPAYTSPTTFIIGTHDHVPPLVLVHHLKTHLRLLRAFHDLKDKVERSTDNVEALIKFEGKGGAETEKIVSEMNAEAQWAWFVGLAVERFERWVKTMPSPADMLDVNQIPPVDVVMIWHAYMLNPEWYSEDCTQTMFNNLRTLTLNTSFLNIVSALINTSQTFPTQKQAAAWKVATGTPFDPIEAAGCLEMSHRKVECPRCLRLTRVPFVTSDEKGYLQQGFRAECASCGTSITRQYLALAKFAKVVSSKDIDSKQPNVFAGTIRTRTNAIDLSRALRLKTGIVSSPQFRKSQANISPAEWRKEIYQRMDNSIVKAHSAVLAGLRPNLGPLVKRIMSAYTDDRLFSVDLVGAVLRQGSFIAKMVNFGWTDSGFFESIEDEAVFVHAIARYHAFLDLMTSSPASFCVPTLDIDLVWHTHQLMGAQYEEDCMKYVGRHVDHDDRVEATHLANSFDLTCRAWQQRFNVPYTHCGCPLPGNTIGQRLKRLGSIVLNSQSKSPSNHFLYPPGNNPTAFEGTHPSEHNCVRVYGLNSNGNETVNTARAEKMRLRRERDARSVRHGKMSDREFRRGEGHDPAFLVPVPFYYPAALDAGLGPSTYTGAGVCAVGASLCTGGSTTGGGGCGSASGQCSSGSWNLGFGSGSNAGSCAASTSGTTSACGGGTSTSACGGGTSSSACGGASSSACGGGSSSACGGGGGC